MKPLPKWLLMTSSLATGVTGIVYFALDIFYVPTDPFAISHPLEPWLLKAHILVAPALVFAIGLIAVDHIWKHYRCLVPAGRRSGLLATIAFVPMVLSGYLIQAVTSVPWLDVLGWTHMGAGVIYLASLILHQRVFKGAIPEVTARVRAGRHRTRAGRRLPQLSGERAETSGPALRS